jgi:hypothetical protein
MSNELKHAVALKIVSSQDIASKEKDASGKRIHEPDVRDRLAQGLFPSSDSPSGFIAEVEEACGVQAAHAIVEIGASLYWPKSAKLFTDRAGGKITDKRCSDWVTEHGFDDEHQAKLKKLDHAGRIAYARDRLAVGVATADDKDATAEDVKVTDQLQKERKERVEKLVAAKAAARLAHKDNSTSE